MSLKGDLKEISIENIFQMIFIEEKNGSLRVVSEGHSAEIFFHGGKIHFAKLDDAVEKNRLKLTLVNNGYLTEKEWSQIGVDENISLEALWSALLTRLDRSTLSSLFLRQIEYTVFVMLQWKEGEYEYLPKATPPVNQALLDLFDGKHILIEGFRAIDEWAELAIRLPSSETFLRSSKKFKKLITSSNPLSENENYIASILTKGMQLKELLDSSKIFYCETGKIVEKLLSLGIIKLSREFEDEKNPDDKHINKWIYLIGSITLPLLIFYVLYEPDYFIKQISDSVNGVFIEESEGENRKTNILQTTPMVIKKEPVKEEVKNIVTEASGDGDGTGESIDVPMNIDKTNKINDSEKKYAEPINGMEQSSRIIKSKPNTQQVLKADSKILNDKAKKTIGEKNEIVEKLLMRADLGETEAQLELGIIYDTGRAGVKENNIKAAKWYQKAAQEGLIPDAQFALGVMYHSGEGVKRNYVKAIGWYSKAAEQGYGEARYNLGIMYYKGEGVKRNKKIAADWFYKSGLSFLSEDNKAALLMAIEALKKIDPKHPDVVKLSEKQEELIPQ